MVIVWTSSLGFVPSGWTRLGSQVRTFTSSGSTEDELCLTTRVTRPPSETGSGVGSPRLIVGRPRSFGANGVSPRPIALFPHRPVLGFLVRRQDRTIGDVFNPLDLRSEFPKAGVQTPVVEQLYPPLPPASGCR